MSVALNVLRMSGRCVYFFLGFFGLSEGCGVRRKVVFDKKEFVFVMFRVLRWTGSFGAVIEGRATSNLLGKDGF